MKTYSKYFDVRQDSPDFLCWGLLARSYLELAGLQRANLLSGRIVRLLDASVRGELELGRVDLITASLIGHREIFATLLSRHRLTAEEVFAALGTQKAVLVETLSPQEWIQLKLVRKSVYHLNPVYSSRHYTYESCSAMPLVPPVPLPQQRFLSKLWQFLLRCFRKLTRVHQIPMPVETHTPGQHLEHYPDQNDH